MALIKLNRYGVCSVCWDPVALVFVAVDRRNGRRVGESRAFRTIVDIACHHTHLEIGGNPFDYMTRRRPEKTTARAGTGVICEQQGRFLTGVRGEGVGHSPGLVCFPGGSIDFGPDHTDTPREAEREFEEETGLKCKVDPGEDRLRPELFVTNCYFENGEASEHYVTFYMLARLTEEHAGIDFTKPVPGTEPDKCAEWRWRTFREIIAFCLGKDAKDISKFEDPWYRIDKKILQWVPVEHIYHCLPRIGVGWDGTDTG